MYIKVKVFLYRHTCATTGDGKHQVSGGFLCVDTTAKRRHAEQMEGTDACHVSLNFIIGPKKMAPAIKSVHCSYRGSELSS